MWAELLSATALIVAALFILASIAKLRNLGQFAEELADYGLLPRRILRPVAVALPIFELVAAGLVIVPSTRDWGSSLLIGLLILFTGAVAINLYRGNTEISCACFSAENQQLSIAIPVRNVAMAVALAGGLVSGFDSVTNLGAVLAALTAALLLSAVVTALEMRDSAQRLAERVTEVRDA